MKARLPAHDAIPTLRSRLLGHYDQEARDLPWRGETDPYRIWVSEVMLQQTRVETVTRYYDPWLRQFPDVETLAEASEDRVLKAWEGLGYYRRARSLHRAAAIVCDRFDGRIPSDREGLMSLPGVGTYTAGAIASIAFGVPTPAVDGNVKRVLSRLYDEPTPTDAWLRDRASGLVDPERPGDWNQALMELGATVCVPRRPRCEQCPVSEVCAAFAAGTQLERPTVSARKIARSVRIPVVILVHEGRVLLVRRPPDGLLGGLWAFPEGRAPDVATEAGCRLADEGVELEPVRHRFTHLDATYEPRAFSVTRTDRSRSGPPADARWADSDEADHLALPVAQRKIFDLWAVSRDRGDAS